MDLAKRTLTSTEEIVLKDSIADVQEWVDSAVTGKINKCKLQMIAEWHPKLTADPAVENIPADDDKLIAVIVARDDYKTAKERKEEAAVVYPPSS